MYLKNSPPQGSEEFMNLMADYLKYWEKQFD